MRHILLIPPGSFLKRDYDRFGIEILKKFFSVKIIDLTPWLYPDISKIYSKQIYQCDEYIPISNKEDFLNCLQYNIELIEVNINEGFDQILTAYLLKRRKIL